MSAHDGRHEQLVRYLLGDVTSPEQERVEEAYVSEGEAFHELLAAEEDLIDAYVAGSLSAADRLRFEQHFLASPARRERVAFARDLARLEPRHVVAPAAPSHRPAWLPVAAVLAPMLLAGAWLLGRMSTLDERVRQAGAEREAALERGQASERRASELEQRVAGLVEDLARARAGEAAAVAAWVLAPGLERGSAAPAFPLSPTTEWVRLRLVLEDDPHPLYEVSVETADGQMVARSSRLRSRAGVGGRAVEVMVPAASLKTGTYVVSVKGTSERGASEGVANYHLRVTAAR